MCGETHATIHRQAAERRRDRCSYLATMRNLKLVTVGWIRNKTRPSPQRFSVAVVSYSFRFLPHTHILSAASFVL